MNNFSNNLISLRKQRNLSQAQLSQYTGLSRSAISMYEAGKRMPDEETKEILADYFNVPMATLMGYDDTISLSNRESDLLAVFRSLSPANQSKVLELMSLYLSSQGNS